MNNSSIVTTTFCRKCYKLRSCLDTKSISNYNYLCKECARVEDLVVKCINCGREATKDILNYSGYCHLCYKDNISECSLCGTETYNNKLIDGICNKCYEGTNKPSNYKYYGSTTSASEWVKEAKKLYEELIPIMDGV